MILIALAAAPVYGQDYGDATVSAVVSVYDGATFRARITDWPAIIGDNIANIECKGEEE